MAKKDYSNAFNLWKEGVLKFGQSFTSDSLNLVKMKKLYQVYSLREGKLPVKVYERKKYLAYLILKSDTMDAKNWWEYSLYQDKDSTGQEHSLKKAFMLEKTNSIYWNALAFFYAEKKNIRSLKEVLERARQTGDPNQAYWYQQKAHYLYKIGLKTEAAAVYLEAKSNGYNIIYKF